jgi:hypothetical protein
LPYELALLVTLVEIVELSLVDFKAFSLKNLCRLFEAKITPQCVSASARDRISRTFALVIGIEKDPDLGHNCVQDKSCQSPSNRDASSN